MAATTELQPRNSPVTKQQFLSRFKQVVDKLCCNSHSDTRTEDAFKHVRRVLEYNVPDGKLNRGMTVVDSYLVLVDGSCDEADLLRAYTLGWTVEIMQAFFLIADDVMDHSLTRRGKPCWYKVPGIGFDAVNDAFFLEQMIFSLLRSEFGDQSYYVDLFHLVHDVIYQTVIGQSLDLITAPIGSVNLEKFTPDRYDSIVTYKTAYYTIYLPVALAMTISGNSNPELLKKVLDVSLDIGRFFQIQDDYLDVFGDPTVTGKIGTDIEDNKCSWLVVQALKLASSSQMQILRENYGKTDAENVKAVKNMYDDMEIEKIYKNFEETSYSEIQTKISSLPDIRFVSIFQSLCKKIYKRSK
jgi:farnesyl diphosphate synthase